ncbi:hypothetical protein RRG08_041746 [Elysia crispata]|uniref:Uncharacterized protein n=1 Tax=Elysia crispata TaxID=231223 RepID=A0AAE0Z0V0_9GAST|nr:hypothetical protein RRG08_041746 [Elysia crispata]
MLDFLQRPCIFSKWLLSGLCSPRSLSVTVGTRGYWDKRILGGDMNDGDLAITSWPVCRTKLAWTRLTLGQG